MARLNILQVFNPYEFYGGEEGSVHRIREALQDHYNMEYFSSSTKEMLSSPFNKKLLWPISIFHNINIGKKLVSHQKVGRFDVLQVHNIVTVHGV